jgi:CRP-like cAMP-binding protein
MAQIAEIISAFLAPRRGAAQGDVLVVPGWKEREWQLLFSHGEKVRLVSGSTLIQRGEDDRALYFLTRGALEIAVGFGAHSLGALTLVYPGSVVGELAFFDGKPRSARVWAVEESDLLRLEYAAYGRFAEKHAGLANDLLFALGCLLSTRLRYTTARAANRGG